MPGFFGAIGLHETPRATFASYFGACWPGSRALQVGDDIVGAHAYRGAPALTSALDHRILAVDGEVGSCEELMASLASASQSLPAGSSASHLRHASAASWALMDPTRRTVELSADVCGVFPVYYTLRDDSLAFSSLLKPLARISGGAPNHFSVLQFLRSAAVIGSDTVFANVRRLLPGQVLSFRLGHGVSIREHGESWLRRTSLLPAEREAEHARVWSSLRASSSRALSAGPTTLMMSGGWDSRTLLAASLPTGRKLRCYSHGDVQSRELSLVRTLCESTGTALVIEPLDERMFDEGLLDDGFDRTESLSFPHWHLAGRELAASGASSVSAGILGEVLGGHYGPAMIGGNVARARALMSLLRASSDDISPADFNARAVLRHRESANRAPWYLQRDYAMTLEREPEHYNAGVESALDRHVARGVTDETALVEAFITEHRGAQYIAAQLRSCRAHLDISVPFADTDAFTLATQMPLAQRIHNRLNRRLLLEHAPALTRFPLAATLVDARRPIAVQEASRAARKLTEFLRLRLQRSGVLRSKSMHFGWVNFEFLRGSAGFRAQMDSLRADIWDRTAIESALKRLETGDARLSPHPLFDQLMKVKTMDRLLTGTVEHRQSNLIVRMHDAPDQSL